MTATRTVDTHTHVQESVDARRVSTRRSLPFFAYSVCCLLCRWPGSSALTRMALTIIAIHGNLATQEMEQVVHLVTAALTVTVTVDASLLLLCPCPSLCALHSFPVDVLVPRLRPASRVKGRVSLLSLSGLEGRAGSEAVLVLSAQATASRRVCISSDAACSRARYAEEEKGRALAAQAGQGRAGQGRRGNPGRQLFSVPQQQQRQRQEQIQQ